MQFMPNQMQSRRAGRLHAGRMLSLVAGVLLLQYVVETVPYDISDLEQLVLLLALGRLAGWRCSSMWNIAVIGQLPDPDFSATRVKYSRTELRHPAQ